MTEEEARAWIHARFGAAGVERMRQLVAVVTEEAARQNLVAPSTLPHMWNRHIVDSAQLISLAAHHRGDWLDIGTGAGFPGMVVAALTDRTIVLAEPRARRVAFLRHLGGVLAVGDRITVLAASVEHVAGRFAVVSARAVASLPRILAAAMHCADDSTLWLLPKGRSARGEVELASEAWHGRFHVEHSITDRDSLIVRATGVARR